MWYKVKCGEIWICTIIWWSGAGLFGAVFAQQATKAGKTVLVVDRRGHIGGNAFTEDIEGVTVHKYGAHIFHTSDKDVWEYVNRFAEFNRYTNSPMANYKGELYNLPFNMNTFYHMWGVRTPQEAKAVIDEQVARSGITDPQNLEEQAIHLVGTDIYEKLIKGYTEKQWGKDARELPAFIIKRLPLRFTFDNNYFNDPYQGVPLGGYTPMIEHMLENAEVHLNVDYLAERDVLSNQAKKIVYCGAIDEYYGYCYGCLEYRGLRFDTKIFDGDNFQGNAVINYTDRETPYTRVIEHRHFEGRGRNKTVVTYEYSQDWNKGDEPYYPVNDEYNTQLYNRYQKLASTERSVVFGGRLGKYRYADMDKVIREALELAVSELGR